MNKKKCQRLLDTYYDRTFLEYGGDVVYTKIKNKE